MVFNVNRHRSDFSGVLDMTISDHFFVYAVLDLEISKPKAYYITTRSYTNYNAEQFSSDISRISWIF